MTGFRERRSVAADSNRRTLAAASTFRELCVVGGVTALQEEDARCVEYMRLTRRLRL